MYTTRVSLSAILVAICVPSILSAGNGYTFSNLQTCYMAASASQDFSEADCDAAWDQAVENSQIMAKIDVCDASSGPSCGTTSRMQKNVSEGIAAGIAAGHLILSPKADPRQ